MKGSTMYWIYITVNSQSEFFGSQEIKSLIRWQFRSKKHKLENEMQRQKNPDPVGR